MNDKELWALIGSLSLAEKASLCSGADYWTTKAIPEKGIPSLRMADGPHGLRYEEPEHQAENGGASRRATCFPPACALACSFSPGLAREVGNAIAEEALENGVGLVLGPGVNIKRSPLCGRNFEYFSEDPLLAGEMAAGMVNGLQEKGVGASVKHYAANNQETLRMTINAAVDPRALHDIYLRAFEIAVKKAQPATVMASYNRVNGQYACENRALLCDTLRLRFGFTGAVLSDWGAVYRRPEAVAAGLDLEMPSSGGVNDAAIEQAVNEGRLSMADLDTACHNLLRLVFQYEKSGPSPVLGRHAAHHALAAEALCQSAVLLKNEGQLPLAANQTLAVIGEMAAQPRFQGGGSSHINAQHLVSFTAALDRAGLDYVYTPGHRGMETNDALLLNAVAAAQKAENVVLFLGLPDLLECEGYDREHLRLPDCQLRLLDAVCAASPRVCVVLSCGAPVEAPWLHRVQSLLCLYLGGEALGEATLALLLGQRNPGGKLAESWPLALADSPCYHHFPMGPDEVRYNESIYVGYRYYSTAQKPVLFPFGHGLSYTQFAYENLTLSCQKLRAGGGVKLACRVKNTGGVAGEEIVQVYAARPGSAVFRPAQELVGFLRLRLQPGEEQTAEIQLPYEQFAHYDSASGCRVVEGGFCTLLVGASSADIRLRGGLELEGVALHPREAEAATGPYGRIRDNLFPTADFAALYGRPLSENRPPRPGQYTETTPLAQMEGSFWGRRVLNVATAGAGKFTHFSKDPEVNKRAVRQMVRDTPLKNLPLQTQGMVDDCTVQAVLGLFNGQNGPLRVLGSLHLRKILHDSPFSLAAILKKKK